MIRLYRTTSLLVLLPIILGSEFLGISSLSQGEDSSELYSDALQAAVKRAGGVRAGFRLVTWGKGEVFCPEFIPVQGLDTPKAVPFLIDVLQNGPSWMDEEFKKKRSGMYFHIARCYAALCLGAIGDHRAFSPLMNILQKEGDPVGGLIVTSEEKDLYPVLDYAVLGLGYLGDPNAVEPLIEVLQDKKCEYAVYALTWLHDVKAIKPIIGYISVRGECDYRINGCLEYLSCARFRITYSSESHTYTTKDLSALGQMAAEKLYKSIWERWLAEGDIFAKRQFDEYYSKWKRLQQEKPGDQNSLNHLMNEMSRGGLACLPFVIGHVTEGDESLIPIISRLVNRSGYVLTRKLRRGTIKENMTRSECPKWWADHGSNWRVF